MMVAEFVKWEDAKTTDRMDSEQKQSSTLILNFLKSLFRFNRDVT